MMIVGFVQFAGMLMSGRDQRWRVAANLPTVSIGYICGERIHGFVEFSQPKGGPIGEICDGIAQKLIVFKWIRTLEEGIPR